MSVTVIVLLNINWIYRSQGDNVSRKALFSVYFYATSLYWEALKFICNLWHLFGAINCNPSCLIFKEVAIVGMDENQEEPPVTISVTLVCGVSCSLVSLITFPHPLNWLLCVVSPQLHASVHLHSNVGLFKWNKDLRVESVKCSFLSHRYLVLQMYYC
jgi:hypothetical protein